MIPIFTSLVLGLLLLLRPLSSLYPLLFDKSARIDVPFHNDELTGTRFWILFFYFIFSSVARRLGLTSPSRSTDISVRMPFRSKREDVELYLMASLATCSTEEILDVPAHLQLFLSALTEPAMLVLLAKRGCPIDPIGAVNVRNRFELSEPSFCVSALKDPARLYIAAKLSEEVVKVKRGWEYSIIVELKSKNGSRKGDTALYRQIFTMLQFAKHHTPVPPISQADSHPTTTVTHIQLTANDPTLWAKLSKDYNPIHMSALAARLLGFKMKIAHGNHVAAKAIEAALQAERRSILEDGPGDEHKKLGLSENGIMEVDFKRPSFVPCDVEVKTSSALTDRETYVEIVSKDKVLITIRCRV
ncbi:hypothetical protein I317_00530 [Kwoniella heveanensis CBS 569]|uniref:MaoC-like domain-containing protein n=1 Tax=Kwoniella heveanensis BCC8398 TaxID=1296120 RepID=A0A1B9GY88_9TREE|nr:hypothetical protein I316_02503 [Kwoniella heveanensis BCC8398]OCF45628.1 hypothetical protein I317_00530 [Kwoniella heveanensis CBS 569]